MISWLLIVASGLPAHSTDLRRVRMSSGMATSLAAVKSHDGRSRGQALRTQVRATNVPTYPWSEEDAQGNRAPHA